MDMASVVTNVENKNIDDFYLIGELAEQAGVKCGAIRFYERQGLLSPRRHGRMRVFAKGDADRLRFILELREIGLPVKTIRKLLDEGQKHRQNFAVESLKAALEQHKAELLQQQCDLGNRLNAVRQKLGEPLEGG
jgi:DNA-binding transcriptional MerR regulator